MGKTVVAAMAAAGLLASLGQGLAHWADPSGCVGTRHVRINDVSGYEGNAPARATTKFVFEVTSTGCADAGVMSYQISDIDGTTPSDLDTGFGFLSFDAGDMAPRLITVGVMPDNKAEHDEVFAVWLYQPQVGGPTVDDCVGGGTIDRKSVV